MVTWIRYYLDDEDVESFHELDDEGWTRRQADLRGPNRTPVTAATRDEVLYLRDHEDLASMRSYERRYGVLAEAPLADWREIDSITEVPSAEFEQVWNLARRAMGEDLR